MRRLLFAIVLAAFLLALVVFVLSNRDDATFGYEMVFKFNVPYLLYSYSRPVPVGYVLLMAFCIGMVTTPFLEALPSLYKSMELRAKNKRIRQLERELSLVRDIIETERREPRLMSATVLDSAVDAESETAPPVTPDAKSAS